jgi:glycosyltransferase involved in cell wall biosynthesis
MSYEEDVITVAMTLKNSMKTLNYSLEGIRGLQYDRKKMKLVFVDGGSTDGSFELLQRFRCENIGDYRDIVLVRGDYDVVEGRNLCIRYAEGKFILFVDSDVVVPPNLLLEVESVFSSDPKVAFINVPAVVERGREGWIDKVYKSMNEPQGMSCAAIRLSALRDVGAYFVGFSKGENPDELIFRLKSRGYKYVVSKERAVHIKEKPRGFFDYLKTSFSASVIYHYQQILSGRRYVLLKYAYYTSMLISILLIPFSPKIFSLISASLYLILMVYYIIRSHGNIHSLLMPIAGLILPIGMLWFIVKKHILKRGCE